MATNARWIRITIIILYYLWGWLISSWNVDKSDFSCQYVICRWHEKIEKTEDAILCLYYS